MKEYRVYTGERDVFGLSNPVNETGLFYIAYQNEQGAIIKERGRVLIPSDEAFYQDLRKNMPEYSVLRISAQKEDNTFHDAVLLEKDATSTPEEAAFLEKEALPVTFTDPDFGEFNLNKSLDYFEGYTQYEDRKVSISLDDFAEIKTLRTILKEDTEFIKKAAEFAANEMLELGNTWYRDAWESEEKEPGEEFIPLTAEDFIQKISLTVIGISEDGRFSLWFDDGDIFWGHAVAVEGSLSKGFTGANIHG
jgi:Uncharacterized protein conserved in bacteria